MQSTRLDNWLKRGTRLFLFSWAICGSSFGAQFDAPYYALEKIHADQWAKENQAVDAKLAELEKRFGTKPNIVSEPSELDSSSVISAAGMAGCPERRSLMSTRIPKRKTV